MTGHWEPVGTINGMQVSRYVNPALEPPPPSRCVVDRYPDEHEKAIEVYPETNGDIHLDIGGHDERSKSHVLSADQARALVSHIETALAMANGPADETWLDLQLRYSEALADEEDGNP